MESTILALLAAGILFTWVMRKIRFPDVLGYILGGFLVAFFGNYSGLEVERVLSYFDPLKWLGLTLFAFELGASIGFKEITNSARRIAAVELIILALAWIVSSLLVHTLYRGEYFLRLLILLFLINSSSAAIVALRHKSEKLPFSESIKNYAVAQTSLEDLLQFILFAALVSLGSLGDPLGALKVFINIAALAFLFAVSSKYFLKPLMLSSISADKEGKFFLAITVAIVYAAVATAVGLPPLFGAFIGGATFTLFHKIDDITELLKGPKDIGLLLYFTSIGFELYLNVSKTQDASILVSGVLIGLAAVIARTFGLFLGSALSGAGISKSLALSIFLMPISEMGLVFADTLANSNIISKELVSTLTIAVCANFIIFGFCVRLANYLKPIENLMPERFTKFVDSISRIYMRRVDFMISILSLLIKFSAVLLLLSYSNSILKYLIEFLNLPHYFALFLNVLHTLFVLLVFIMALRSVYSNLLKSLIIQAEVGKIFDLVIGMGALSFQIFLIYDFIANFEVSEPVHRLILFSVHTIIILVTIYELVKYMKLMNLSDKSIKKT